MSAPHLEKLTYVYAGEPGPVGDVLLQCKRVLRFGADGSGMIQLSQLPAPGDLTREVTVNVSLQERDAVINREVAELVGDDLPCLVGHAGSRKEIVVNSTSLARCGRSPSEVRGKVRFGLALLGWELPPT